MDEIKYIKTIVVNHNIIEIEIVCSVCGRKTMIYDDEMVDCNQCGSEIPEYIDKVWKEYSKLSKEELVKLIKYKN